MTITVRVLSVDEIVTGIRKTIRSGHRLYLSGVVLDANGLIPPARAMLSAAVEEYGKIGCLYALLVHMPEAEDASGWKSFWSEFRSHKVKNDIGRQMMLRHTTGNLLPLLARYLMHRLPLWSTSPQRFELTRRAMLYTDLDDGRNTFMTPEDYFDERRPFTANAGFIEDVEKIVRYVQTNVDAHVFDARVMAAFRELNGLAGYDEQLRVHLNRLFYASVLRRPTGYQQERTVDEVAAAARASLADKTDEIIARWRSLGDELQDEGSTKGK